MNKNKIIISPLNVLITSISFWITVILVRGIIYWSIQHNIVPAIFVRGFHIHHFITGFLLLIIAVICFIKKIWFRAFPVVIFGSGLGLVADEFLFWTRGHFNYWSMVNLFAVITIGSLLSLYYLHIEKKDFDLSSLPPKKIKSPHWMVILGPLVVMIFLLLNWFSYQNIYLSDAKEDIGTYFIQHTHSTTTPNRLHRTPK